MEYHCKAVGCVNDVVDPHEIICTSCYEEATKLVISKTGLSFTITACNGIYRFLHAQFICDICKKQRHHTSRLSPLWGLKSNKKYIQLNKLWKLCYVEYARMACIYCRIQAASVNDPFESDGQEIEEQVCGNCLSYGEWTRDRYESCGTHDNDEEISTTIINDVKSKLTSYIKWQESLIHKDSILAFYCIWRFDKNEHVKTLPKEIVNIIISFIQGV